VFTSEAVHYEAATDAQQPVVVQAALSQRIGKQRPPSSPRPLVPHFSSAGTLEGVVLPDSPRTRTQSILDGAHQNFAAKL
jgi:hypothetical protein